MTAAALDQHRDRLRRLPQPEPSLGIAAYRAEIEGCLAADPRRRANWDLAQTQRGRAGINYLPTRLDIENVSRCNFRCTMCVVSDWDKGRRAADMSVDDFKRLIDEQHGLVEIKLQGIGEPVLQGDDLFEMISYARQRRIWVRTTTNASLLHLRDNHRKLIDTGVNEVQVSIDGADAETFQSIRRGSVFERVASNCQLLNAYCREAGRPVTKMWTVVQKANAHQLEQLVDHAGEWGFHSLVFSLNVWDWALENWTERNTAVTVDHTLDPDRLEGLIERGRRQGVTVTFWHVSERYSTRAGRLCPWPFERAYVSSDMRVVPCCFISNPDVYELGTAQAFSDVWLGSGYQEFRQAHIDGRIPKICQGCYEEFGR